MIPINSAIAVLVFLVGVVLTAAVAVNLITQHLLKQCKDMLDFALSLDKLAIYRLMEQEDYKHEGTD